MKFTKILTVLALAASLFAGPASAYHSEKPSQYFNDYASVVSASRAADLNNQLADYERKTSNQFVVVVEPDEKLTEPIEKISIELSRSWGIGQKGAENQLGTANRDNGILLLVFPKAHKMRLEVGKGLEGAIPDSVANEILRNTMVPQFKSNSFDAGLTQGIAAVMDKASAEGNKGVNRTVEEQRRDQQARTPPVYSNNKQVVAATKEKSSGHGFMTFIILLIVGAVVFFCVKYLLFGKKNDSNDDTYTNIHDKFNSYHNDSYVQPAYTPPTPPARRAPKQAQDYYGHSKPSWTRNYTPPAPATHSSNTGAILGGAAAGALAGVAAEELFKDRSDKNEKKKRDDDDSSYSGGATSSWTAPDPTPSYSAPDPTPSYSAPDTSSSWIDTSTTGGFDGGGGGFDGGGSSTDW